MFEHFLNTCPVCGDITKCRCSSCNRAHTFNVCARCREEETTADYTDTAPSPASDRESSRRVHKPLPYDAVQFYLPILMRRLGFSHLRAALESCIEEESTTTASGGGASWNTFFDPLTKHHIIKTGRLPGKKKKMKADYKLQAQLHKLGFKHLASIIAQVQLSEYEIPNKVFKDKETSNFTSSSDDASLDHIRGEHSDSGEAVDEYLDRLERAYRGRHEHL